jgi:hypothetical protein
MQFSEEISDLTQSIGFFDDLAWTKAMLLPKVAAFGGMLWGYHDMGNAPPSP